MKDCFEGGFRGEASDYLDLDKAYLEEIAPEQTLGFY